MTPFAMRPSQILLTTLLRLSRSTAFFCPGTSRSCSTQSRQWADNFSIAVLSFGDCSSPRLFAPVAEVPTKNLPHYMERRLTFFFSSILLSNSRFGCLLLAKSSVSLQSLPFLQLLLQLVTSRCLSRFFALRMLLRFLISCLLSHRSKSRLC